MLPASNLLSKVLLAPFSEDYDPRTELCLIVRSLLGSIGSRVGLDESIL